MLALKWRTHADLAIRKTPTVGRDEYLDYMTFRRNDRPLFTEIFGPIIGLKEEWLSARWQAVAQEGLARDSVIAVSIPGGFDELRELLGEENLCMAYYEQPELIQDILHTIGETALAVLDRVSAAVPVDVLYVHEDLAGKSGPLVGPAQIREFVVPYYRRIWNLLQARGARLFDQDSDGDMNPLLDVFLEAGVNCMHPMEPAANMDIVAVRQKYGTRLAFYGGLDKHVLRRSKEEIARELAYKIPPMVKTGGCVLALDHRVPNGTSLENYRFYLKRAWEIMERELPQLFK